MALAMIGADVSQNYKSVSSTAVPDAESGKQFSLGDRYIDYAGNAYVFISASTSITSYQCVAITSQYYGIAATSAAAAAASLAGIAGVNGISAGSYGWVQTRGNMTVNVLSTCSASSWLYTTATAGSLDDTSTSQVKVAGLTINANATTPAAAAAFAGIDIYFAL